MEYHSLMSRHQKTATTAMECVIAAGTEWKGTGGNRCDDATRVRRFERFGICLPLEDDQFKYHDSSHQKMHCCLSGSPFSGEGSHFETGKSLCTESQTSSPKISSDHFPQFFAHSTPLCKPLNSVKISYSYVKRGGSNRLLYLILCLLFSSSSTVQVFSAESCTECLTNCDCVKAEDGYCEVDCSGLNWTVLPTAFEFKNVSLLDLSNNELVDLPETFFLGMRDLKQLFLHRNRLVDISKSLFQNLPTLRNLTLSANNWRCTSDLIWLQELLLGSGDLGIDVLDAEDVLCSRPSSLQNQTVRSVNLSTVKCAASYVSCYHDHNVENGTVIIWEYTDLETTENGKSACKADCYTQGYSYATLYSKRGICLCASRSISSSFDTDNCSDVCGADPLPATVCEREVIDDEVMLACISFKFDGIRTYSQHEAVEINIITEHTIVTDFIWDFNDSTAVIYTKQPGVLHKYALAGVYYVSITVSCGEIFESYSFPITIEEPIGDVELMCPPTAKPNTPINLLVAVSRGSGPRLMWTSSHDGGATSNDDTFMPDGAVFFDERRVAYQAVHGHDAEWHSAKTVCEGAGGLLAVVDGTDVTDFIMDIVKDLSDKLFWIGVVDGNLGGTFFQITGQSISDSTYRNWAEGEPNIQEPLSKCAVLNATNGGKWYTQMCSKKLPYICQFQSSDTAIEPMNFIAGTILFGSSSTSALANLTIESVPVSTQPVRKEKIYTIIFPGLWMGNEGVMSSWEFTGPAKARNSSIRLQLYRPSCPSLQVVKPGCNGSSPFLTCASSECLRKLKTCSNGLKYCSITESCKAQSQPCSMYAESGTSEIPNLSGLKYTLISDHLLKAPKDKSAIYQVNVPNGQTVRADDVIAVAFSHTASNPEDIDVSDLPLLCQRSNLSIWRQDALLVQTDNWTNNELDLTSKRWVESIWCDIRVHYSEKSGDSVPKTAFLTPNLAGNYTYTAIAFNNVSQSDPVDSSASCMVEVIDSRLVVSVVVIGPEPSGTSSEGNSEVYFSERNQTITVKVTGGAPNVSVEWEGVSDSMITTKTENKCPEELRTIPACMARSGEVLQTTSTTVLFEDDRSLDISITARNPYSARTIIVRVILQQNITGLRILPTATNRILANVPQVFSGEVDTGTDVEYSWFVDEVTEFTYKSQVYNVLFRTPAEYCLTLQAENNIGVHTKNITLVVDEMNPLKDLVFTTLPNVAERNTTLDFKAEFLVDENIDFQVEWTIVMESNTDPVVLQPHAGEHDPDHDIERVYAETNRNWAFVTTGQKEIEVRVFNDYDSITKTGRVDVREPLVAVAIEMISTVPAVGDALQFQSSGTPSTYGASFWYSWGDGSAEDGPTGQADATHIFPIQGTYVVNVTADNEINIKWNTTTITVYERVTDLTLETDGPTEIGLNTTIMATLSTGNTSALFSYEFDEASMAPIINSSTTAAMVMYPTAGRYNVSVTAENIISSQQEFVEVHVFTVDIVNVSATEECIKKDSAGTLQAFMPTDVVTLFDYTWTFEDGSVTNVNASNMLNHVFETVGERNVTVRVTSRASGKYDEQFALICVQEVIGMVSVGPIAPVQLGQASVFNLSVSGGSSVNYTMDFGDGGPVTNVESLEVNHSYSHPGNYTVTFMAENLVGKVDDSGVAIVQEAIQGSTISTTSSFELIAKNHSFTYFASTTTGTDIIYMWDFGDGTPVQYGNDIRHTYTRTGYFTIKATLWNLISSENATLYVTVKEPIVGAAIVIPGTVIRVNSTVNFTASIRSGGPEEVYYWKVTPGMTNYTSGSDVFSYEFTEIKNYSVSVKIENEVSVEYEEVFVLAADTILGINISTISLVDDKYTARNQSAMFEVLLKSGEQISSTTAGSANALTSVWEIEVGGVVEQKYRDTAVITHKFEQIGIYEVRVNISNGVSFQEASIEVHSIDRVGSISFIVIEGFNGAAKSSQEVKIMALVSLGTALEFYWNPNDGTGAGTVQNENLTHVYSVPDTYYPFVTVCNVLGNKTESYELIVQDEVTGLVIDQIGAIVPFYVPYMRPINFQAFAETGTDISYSWYYEDKNGDISDIENSTDVNMKWKFPEVTTYTLIVNASNLVSWDQVNHTVTVMQAVHQLEIEAASFLIPTGSSIQINATIVAGDDVSFTFSLDGLVLSGLPVTDKVSYVTYPFSAPGIYKVTVQASNNVSVTNKTRTISVRDPIIGVRIDGCCVSGQYIETGQNLTFTALLASGTNATYDWNITYETGGLIRASGAEIHELLVVPGKTLVSLFVDNGVSEQGVNILLHLQDRCIVILNIKDAGRTLYINENVTLHIKTLQGTNVSHDVDFGDSSPHVVTQGDSAVHAYQNKGDYTVTVVSSNNVASVHNTASVSISRLECAAPSISFVARAYSKFFRSRTIYVEAKVDINCTAYEVDYSWRIYRQDDCSDLDDANLAIVPATSNRPLLVLPALTLEVSNYCFQIEVSYLDTYLSDADTVSIGVLSTPLTVVIIGGTTRFLYKNAPLVLDASFSFDPDLSTEQHKGLSYLWLCNSSNALPEEDYGYEPGNTTKADVCLIPIEGLTQPNFTLAAGTLNEEKQYDYTVKASKIGKSAFATQRVVVVSRSIPTTTITCFSCYSMASYVISASFHLGLKGSCDTCESTDEVSYVWEVLKLNTNESPEVFPLDEWSTTTGGTSQYLVVKEGALENSHTYEFKLRVQVGDKEGYSKLVLSPNQPPTRGFCKMDHLGNQAYVLTTTVSFACSDWEDEGSDNPSPLVYTIIAFRHWNGGDSDTFILYRGTQDSHDAYLPLGLEEHLNIINVKILVEDQLGTSAVGLDENITVVQGPSSSISWLREKTESELGRLMKLKDPQDIIDFSAAAITLLNSESRHSSGVIDDEYSDRVYVRERLTRTIASIATSTFKEVQQLASVLEQCVKVSAEFQNSEVQKDVSHSVDAMVSQMADVVLKEGQSTFQKATSDVLDIVGSLIRIVNFVVYDNETAMIIKDKNSNVSIDYSEVYRQEMITNLTSNIVGLVSTVLSSKVLGEESVTFSLPTVSVTSMRTTPKTAPKVYTNAGIHCELPAHTFDDLNPDEEIFAITMSYEQNPYTFGLPPHNLSSSGYANITSRVSTIEFSYPNGTIVSIGGLASTDEDHNRRVKLVMAESSWNFMSDMDILQTLNGTLYQPRTGLTFETADLLQPLQSIAVTLTNKNTDPDTAVHIMVTYTKKYPNNKGDPNPTVGVYFGYTATPNRENNSATRQLTDDVMADGKQHELYTFFLEPRYNVTINPEYYLNISNYFSYEILEIQIAVYYTRCFYIDTDETWKSDGLFPSAESTYTVSVCYSDHLTSFGSFVINPPNLVNVTDIVNIDFSQNPIALITVSVTMFLYIVAMIWARRLDLRDIKRSSLIPLCGSNGSFKYEITIKTAAGMGSGTTANVGICVYGYDRRSGSRHLARKGAFERGAVDTMQVASDVSLGEIYKIKLWHDNTGLDPGWCVDRVMVRDLQDDRKYFFLVNSWLQVYPDDEDETCLEKVVRVATEEELTNFSNIFGSQLSYGWEDAHLWISVIERPARSRFTRVQRVTCCVTLLLTFMVFSAMWYQGYDANGEVVPEDTLVGIIRWKDIAVGAIVSLMVFPASLVIVCMFKKSRNQVDAVKPWLDRAQTAQTIEIWDEIIEGKGRRSVRTSSGLSDMGDYYCDTDPLSKCHGRLSRQNDFLTVFPNENVEDESILRSGRQTPLSEKGGYSTHDALTSGRSKLHKSSGTVKSLDIREKVWSSDDSAVQLSSETSSSGVTGSVVDMVVSSLDERTSSSGSREWPNRSSATKTGLLHKQDDENMIGLEKFTTTSLIEKSVAKPLRRKNTTYVRSTGSVSPPNFIPDEDDDDEFDEEIWEAMSNESLNTDDSLMFTNKQVALRRTRRTKFGNEETIPLQEEVSHSRGLAVDDVIVDQSYEDSEDSDVPLPEFSTSRGHSRNLESQASTFIGTSPQPSSEEFLLPHWCIYVNYVICCLTMAVCIFFIILYGNDFGPDTTKRWLLSMFVALLESFFIVEPIKVVLFAVFLAVITKPVNPEENDNLVDEPLVETYGTVDSYSKVRAPGGFALDKCKREAHKTKRSDNMLLNLAIYLVFLSSVAAVASWDRDTMGYLNTVAIRKSLFNSPFTLAADAQGPRWMNDTATFDEIRTVADVWAWLDQVFTVKIFENKSTQDNQNLNNILLGQARLRQQRGLSETCAVNTTKTEYNELTYVGQECLRNDVDVQQTESFAPGWTGVTDSNDTWDHTHAEFGGVKYWGEDFVYDDSGYVQYLNGSSSVASAQLNLESLKTSNWIDRKTSVVFVEFTQLNPATYWFTVCVVMFEMGVTGAVRPSYSVQTVRVYQPSTNFYVDMLFMLFVAVIGILLLLKEIRKITDPKITSVLYFTKWTNWINLLVLALTITLCVIYICKEVYMEEVMNRYVSDKTGFTNFYKVAFYANLMTCFACILLAVVIARAARLLRFIKCWSVFGNTIAASAHYLLGATLMLMILILAFAMLGYLVYGQSCTQVVEEFRDFPNSLYAMIRSFRGRMNFRTCFDASPFFSIFFFFTFYFGVFWLFCRLFAAILINEYKYVRARKFCLSPDIPDYEILDHLVTRIKMRLGIIKPKQFRPMVRFEGMSTPSSRGSFMSLDSFDTCFMPGRISQCSYATGISSSSSDSGLGTPSDHSLSVYDYLTLEQPSDRPMDPMHLDYLYGRLSNYSVDMMLHHFERVNQLGDDVLSLEKDLLQVTERVGQRRRMQSQSREIALAASSMTLQPNYISPNSEGKQSEGSTATFSSRGHFSLQSQQTLSQASLSGGRIESPRFQTVLNSMFPIEHRYSGISDLSRSELDALRRPAVRSGSYAGPFLSQKSHASKSDLRGAISSANSVLRSGGTTGRSTMLDKKNLRQRPHSDEGVRGNTTTSIISEVRSRKSLQDPGNILVKQSSKCSPQAKVNEGKPMAFTMPAKKSAW